jgi:flagellar biogenesis protein FliO
MGGALRAMIAAIITAIWLLKKAACRIAQNHVK